MTSSTTLKRFIAIVKKLRNPKTTILIFPNGKLVITGAKTEEEARKSVRKMKKILEEHKPKVTDFKIQNVVGSADITKLICKKGRSVINLDLLAKLLIEQKKENSSSNGIIRFEPEIYAALTMEHDGTKVVIFHTGKINFTGAKSVEQVMTTYFDILAILEENNLIQIISN